MFWLSISVALFLVQPFDSHELSVDTDGTFLVLISALSGIDDIESSVGTVHAIGTDIAYSDIMYESGDLASITIGLRSEVCQMNSGKPYDQSTEVTLGSSTPIVMVCLSKHSEDHCRVVGVMGCSLEEYEITKEAVYGDTEPSTIVTTWDGGFPALEQHLSKSKK